MSLTSTENKLPHVDKCYHPFHWYVEKLLHWALWFLKNGMRSSRKISIALIYKKSWKWQGIILFKVSLWSIKVSITISETQKKFVRFLTFILPLTLCRWLTSNVCLLPWPLSEHQTGSLLAYLTCALRCLTESLLMCPKWNSQFLPPPVLPHLFPPTVTSVLSTCPG